MIEPLVLLPGTLCDERLFAPVLERLGREAIVPRLTGAETAAEMAAILLHELPPRFALGGFSLGGLVAMHMLAQAPERITRLGMIDTTARPDPEANWTVRRNAVARARELGVDRYVTHKLWSLYVSGDSRADEANRALVGSMSAALGIEAFRQQSEMAISRGDNRPVLRTVRVPTLVLCGVEEKLCPVAVHEEMAEIVPRAMLAVIPRAGHFALIEQPDLVADVMRGWLAAPHALGDAPMKTIAFVGLGRMGLPMATNLLKAGFAVIGCDLDPARTATLAERGGTVAASPGEAAAQADATFSIVMNDAILRTVALGPDGVLAGARAGHMFCDLSTVSPDVSTEVRASADAIGVDYLCGKVAGSIGLAESGGLTLFASGPAEPFGRMLPAFEAMAAQRLHVGDGEAAAYLKLVHSLIIGTYSAMIGEALAFGEKGGLSLERMVDVLEAGPLGSKQLTLKAPILKARDFATPPSDIDTAAKDVDIILETARRDCTPLPLLSAARQVMAHAQATGGGKRDIYSVLEAFERLAGLPSQ